MVNSDSPPQLPRLKGKKPLLFLLRKEKIKRKHHQSPEAIAIQETASIVGIPFWSSSHGKVALLLKI